MNTLIAVIRGVKTPLFYVDNCHVVVYNGYVAFLYYKLVDKYN